MGVSLYINCRRCGRHTHIHWRSKDPQPPLLCGKCSIIEGLEELVPPRWFGAQWWCGLTMGHTNTVRGHKGVWQSHQCRRCGYISMLTHPDMLDKFALEKQQERLELAAGADPEFKAALEETNALERE